MSSGSHNLSVYMPAYNVARFVLEAVQSILTQSLVNFEFIIVDDGSTDATLTVLREVANSDPRVRLVSQPNAGVSNASNHAISLAMGEFIARIDADDVAYPQRLEKQLRYMREHPDCVALGSAMMLIDEEGLPLYPMANIAYGHEKIDAALINGGWPIAQPSCMYRRDAVIAVGGYRTDLSLHEDHDLLLKLAERGRLENLPEVLQKYRQRGTSLMARESARSHHIVMPEIIKQARIRRGLPAAEPAKPDDASIAPSVERSRKWAWRSLKAGNVKTARKYAWATLQSRPLSFSSWKLMYCTLRGH